MEDDFPKPSKDAQNTLEDAEKLCKEARELKRRVRCLVEESKAISDQVFEDLRESQKKLAEARETLSSVDLYHFREFPEDK
jgi:vacuolar-type H+-ATPase subunit D/Vma8